MCLWSFIKGKATPNELAFVVFAPLAALVALGLAFLHPPTIAALGDLVDVTLFNKLASGSGVEREAWNRQAYAAVTSTWWLGAGIGSVRASSWLVAVPANIGAFGALMYGLFIAGTFFTRRYGETKDLTVIRMAAQHACLAQLIASSASGSFIDLGLPFFAFAGASAALVEKNELVSTDGSPHLERQGMGKVSFA
ncbi:MAG: hypothetical protein NVSMB26_00130 [Beijerinckiaceae bacterium]